MAKLASLPDSAHADKDNRGALAAAQESMGRRSEKRPLVAAVKGGKIIAFHEVFAEHEADPAGAAKESLKRHLPDVDVKEVTFFTVG